jgi:hypothetical protein
MRIRSIMAALALAVALNATAAPTVYDGMPPGYKWGGGRTFKTPDGRDVYYGIAETRNGKTTIVQGWYGQADAHYVSQMEINCLYMNLRNWKDYGLLRYSARVVFIMLP